MPRFTITLTGMLKVTIGFMLLIVQYCTNYLEVLPHNAIITAK